MSVRDVVLHSPYLYGDDVIFLGSKASSLFVLDAENGEVHRCFRSVFPPHFLSCHELLHDGCIRESDSVEERRCEIPEDPIFLGRIDYTVRAIDRKSQLERWNITIGEYTVHRFPITSSYFSSESF